MAQRSRAKATPAVDWLPYHGTPIVSTKSLQSRYVDSHKNRDWFLQLATAMESRDATQSKLLIKFYFFLRDFLPQGLAGPYAHIKGNEVMGYLLCQLEHTVSRHKVAKNADAAFAELDRWMGRGKTWREALSSAKADNEKHKRKKASWMAPGLHSPAGLLAVLVLGHPDPDAKFRNLVSHLQIQWMVLQQRETLEVSSGFWEGINYKNLYTVFSPEEIRQPEVPLLADYTDLFSEFVSCRRDIRPHVQPWASEIALSAEPDDLDPTDTEADGGDVASISENTIVVEEASDGDAANEEAAGGDVTPSEPASAEALRKHFFPPTKHPKQLQDWLVNKLADDSASEALPSWCEHWQTRIEAIANLREQTIVRSLFVQSLGRLESFHSSDTSLAEAYMLLDIADVELKLEKHDPSVLQKFKDIPSYQAYMTAVTEFRRHVDGASQTAKDMAEKLLSHQSSFLYRFMRFSTFHNHWKDLMSLEAQRTRLVIYDLEQPVSEDSTLLFWRAKRDALFDEKVIHTLQLTNWQLCNLFSGNQNPLTEPQARIFRQQFCPELVQDGADLSIYTPRSVTPSRLPNDSVNDKYKSLYKLFGEIEQPRLATPALSTARSHTPSGPAIESPNSPVMTWASPAKPATISRGRNAFAGEVFVPAKRPCSPDGRSAKALKLLTRADLVEDLAELRSHWEPELRAWREQMKELTDVVTDAMTKKVDAIVQGALKSQRAELRGELAAQIQPLKDELRQLRSEVHDTSRSQTDELKDWRARAEADSKESSRLGAEVQAKVTALQDLLVTQHTSLQSQIKALRAQQQELSVKVNDGSLEDAFKTHQNLAAKASERLLEEVKSQEDSLLKRFEAKQNARVSTEVRSFVETVSRLKDEVQDALTSQVDHAKSQIEEIKALLAKVAPPQGQQGYLAHECPAPAGKSQSEYESALLRAAWFYINCLGCPDEGVSEDEDTLEVTKARFSSINEDHIVKAIHHVHMQVYGSQLGRSGGR